MFLTPFSALLGIVSALAGVSAAHPGQLQDRAATASSNFSIFAYGSDPDTTIGGYPIFYNDGYAYIANPTKVNYTADYVAFTKNSSDTSSWIASPLTIGNNDWDGSVLYIPLPSGPVGFYQAGVTNASELGDIMTSGFKTYGNTVLVTIDGTIKSNWYAVATEIEGLWSVGWNASGGGVIDSVPIGLSKGKPVNVNYPKH